MLRVFNLVLSACRDCFAPGSIRRILVVKLDAIGDLVIATPFLRELKRSFPSAHVTLVVHPAHVPLVEFCPYIDRVIGYDGSPQRTPSRACNTLRAMLLGHRLSWSGFDVAVLPRWDHDFCNGYYVLNHSGARRIFAYDRTFSAVRDGWLARAERARATVPVSGESQHEVDRNLALVKALGGTVASRHPELWLSDADRSFAREWLGRVRTPGAGPLVALGIGASIEAKCWSEENFAAVARHLAGQFDADVMLVGGGARDQARAGRILAAAGTRAVFSAVGECTLRQTAALLEQCQLFVGNDSGPMHLAAAVRVPVVALFGVPEGEPPDINFSPERFGPWTEPATVLRPPRKSRRVLHPDDRVGSRDIDVLDVGAIDTAAVTAAAESLLRGQGYHFCDASNRRPLPHVSAHRRDA
jgi:ADP-heptose:LPS heptosyltransferase